jgi:hypothetical protein
MDATDRRVTAKFAAFDKEQDPARVLEAMEAVAAAQRDLPEADLAARQRAVSHWLLFFTALDRHIDPQWDPTKVPVKGAALPPVHGVVFPSGEVDPATIPDPAARVEYERTLNASKDYSVWYGVQFQLRRIDENATRLVELLLAERYTNTEEDRRELERLLTASTIDERRRARLRALMAK